MRCSPTPSGSATSTSNWRERTQADFENYRKRMAAEVQAAAVRGKGELAREVIAGDRQPRAGAAAAGLDPEGDSGGAAGPRGAARLPRACARRWQRSGVEAFDPKGEKFDPHWHEALSTAAGRGGRAGTVVEVMQKGYQLGEQLIRPARVVVSE